MDNENKNSPVITNFMQSAVEISKKAASSTKTGITAIIEKAKSDSYARRVKKFNPVFPEQYESNTFHLPNIIVIVDDAVRRDIDVCEGAIGWLGKIADTEILYLYDEAVTSSGVQFIPSPTCDSVFYVDNFDRKRYIRADCIFDKALDERIAELKHIAYSLGAKRCHIEITEISSSTDSKRSSSAISANTEVKNINIGGQVSLEQENVNKTKTRREGYYTGEFKGSRHPQHPTLKWFEHDGSIIALIEMCCNGKRKVKEETYELLMSTSATMSIKAANAIDGALGDFAGIKNSKSMSIAAKKEQHSKMIFHIEF